MWGHHQPDVSDHPEHDGDAPDGVVAVPLLLLGHQDEPEVGQDVGAQHLSVVYLSLLVFLRSECRNTKLCGWCQLVWRNSGNCDRMITPQLEERCFQRLKNVNKNDGACIISAFAHLQKHEQ